MTDDILGVADRLWRGEVPITRFHPVGHGGGLPVWAAEAAERNWPAPAVIAHEAVLRRFDRYRLTAGYNQVINQRQFGIKRLRWPEEYRYPDRTYTTELAFAIGGVEVALRHELGETDDHTVTWLPAQRALCCGDLFIWAAPNAGNPQKVQRYPLEWAEAVYDEPEFVVRTVWRRYGGWWDGNPATLKPAPERALAAELAALAGGAGVLADRAAELADADLSRARPAEGELGADQRVAALPGGEEALRIAGHLAELAWLAAPGDEQVARARHRVFTIRADRATSTMSAGIYRWAAGESLGDPFGQQRGLEAAHDDD